MKPSIAALTLSLALAAGCASPLPPLPALDHELRALIVDPTAPVVSVSALAVRDGRVVYAQGFGHRHLGSRPGDAALPATPRTLYRVASISKLVVAVGVMRLVEQGRLRLDDDVSTLLGWPLRHPQFADRPITLRLLLSHRSGLADGGESYVFDGRTDLRDVLLPGGKLYRNALNWLRDKPPGDWFEYVNLNFGVIATVMERATGERFDHLIDRLVMRPLGLHGGFDPSSFSLAAQAEVATQYRKRSVGDREVWDPAGPWVVQADDFRHSPATPPEGLADYVIGRNGTLFGPQGRLRTDLISLGVLLQMLLDDGRHRGQPFLQPQSVAMLASEQWRLASDRSNGDPRRDWALSWGLGVQRYTDATGPGRGDRLVEGGGFTGWGHLGDAYGLMGQFVLDPASRRGMVVLITGPGVDPERHPPQWSAQTRWMEQALTAVARHALGVVAAR